MWEHTRDVHGGQIGDNGGVSDYRFKVSSNFKRCLLNGKSEFFTPKLVEIAFRQM
jgi:hypothetical protein